MKILIVDDRSENLYCLRELLQSCGYEVDEARHGAEALVKARQAPPQLIISDLLMPVMDGYSLLRQWKADPQLKQIPFVVYTATYTGPQDEKLALDLGADAFILKPVEPDLFMARISEVLAKELAGQPVQPQSPIEEEKVLYKEYSETLIHKLETKMAELEQANRQLQADITERKQGEEALRASEERFRAYVEQAADAMFMHDFSGRFIDVNRQACASLGYSREELLRKSVFDVENDFDLPRAQVAWRQVTAEKPFTLLGHQRRKDGSIFPVEVRFGCFNLKGERCYLGMVRDITERQQAEKALRESERRLHLATKAANVGLWDWDLQTNTVWFSPEWKRQIGYEDHEIPNHFEVWQSRVHPDDLERALARVKAYVEKPWPNFENEFRFRHNDGSYRWILAQASLSPDAQGKLTRVLGSHIDITERKQADQRLHQLNRTYAVLSDINQLIVRERDTQTILDNACRIAVTTGGFLLAWISSRDKASGQLKLTAHSGATPDTLTVIKQILGDPKQGCAFTSQALATGDSAVCNDIERDPLAAAWREAALQRGYRAMSSFPLVVDGQRVGTLNLYAGKPDFFDADELRLLKELAMDISFALEIIQRETEHRHVEESHARLATAVDQAAEVIVITDTSGTIHYVNPAFERISGYTSVEAIGQNPRILKSGKQDAEFYRQMWGVLKQGEIWRGHFINKHKNGALFEEEATISPIRNTCGEIISYVAVKRDVTREMQLESQFRQAQKMEAIGTLAGGIAHDFNNILSAIFSYGCLLQQDAAGNPAAQEDIAELLKAAGRARDLVQQILTFSRQREQKRQVITLNTVIRESTKFLRASLPADIQIEINLAPDAPAVLADPTQIYQVTMNLATNALHALEGKPGQITVSLDAFVPSDQFIQAHPEFRPIQYARMAVADTGHGMDAKTLEHIFEPFFTTKPVGKGTGLGLAVVHGIVQSHDGIIKVESEVGKGTTFSLYFPAQTQPPALSEADPGKMATGHGQQILLLDDESALTTPMQRLLERLNYRVTVSNGASEAIGLFRRNPAQFDLVITDLTMPEMNGFEVARQIHAIRSNAPVILASGHTPTINAENLRKAGIFQLIEKPISMTALADAVHRALEPGKRRSDGMQSFPN